MRKNLALYVLIVCTFVAAKGQTIDYPDLSGLPQQVKAKGLRYWFDSNVGNILTVNGTSDTYFIDVSALKAGIHTVHYQVVDDNDAVAGMSSAVFLKVQNDIAMPANSTASQLRYWFDQETQILYSDEVNGIRMVDVSTLDDGLHTIHYQIIDNLGKVSTPASSTFLKFGFSTNGPSDPVPAKSIRYWFDGDLSTLQVTNIANTLQTIDLSDMPPGIHTLYYQLVDVNDNVGTPATSVFLKNFEKQNTESNRITKYEYWMNSDLSSLQTTTVANAATPYLLTGLFPMPIEQLRSSYFHLEIVDGAPVIYAKNDFHIRFHDARGYFVHDSKPFVDYSVSQAVTDIGLLEPGVRATTERPAENVIKWYKVSVERGDSLQFKLDRAASLQLFAPSGEEVYNVSGAASVRFGGIHAYETGTYYLALHDVTATKGSTVSIDYNLIDKYAVLRQDVKLVGNGGCSTITFEGNGFNDLYAVDLVCGTRTVQQLHIGHESNATTTIVFDFEGCDLGVYDAVFHFTEGDVNVSSILTVEVEKPIELETTVKYHREYMVGKSQENGRKVPYNITVKNKGNSTAYRVPIYILFKGSPGAIVQLESTSVNRPSLSSKSDFEDLSENEIVILKGEFEEIEKDPVSFIIETIDEDDNVKEEIHVMEIFTDISPNSLVSIPILGKIRGTVGVNYNVPKKYPTVKYKSTNNNFHEWYCNEGKDFINCMLGLSSTALDALCDIYPLDIRLKVAGCTIDVLSAYNTARGITSCSTGESAEEEGNDWENFFKNANMTIDVTSVAYSAMQCAKKIIGIKGAIFTRSKVPTLKESGIGMGLTLDNCLKWLLDPPPYKTTPIWSHDPNDIYGYTAESGSKAVKDGLTDVYYTIEFENDPEVATAPAHDVYVTDVLDASKFDLSTFAPTRVKIGDKTAELSGDPNFVTTIDMRPEIYAIAQVEGTFDKTTGTASWHISTLDPMTMEPVDDPLVGVLPVNDGGNGIGEISFDISLKDGLVHGTEVPNSASIVFDTNDAITTPTWTNTIDRIAPESHIINIEQIDDNTATVSIEATDEQSGPWRYDVYVQYGEGSAWWMAAENVTVGTAANVMLYRGINHSFYVVAYDMAGNVEQKEAAREYTLNVPATVKGGDANGDGKVTVTDIAVVVNEILSIPNGDNFSAEGADANGDGKITVTDIGVIVDMILGNNANAGNTDELEPQ